MGYTGAMQKIFGVVLVLLGLIGALYLIATYTNLRQPLSMGEAGGVQVTTAKIQESTSTYTINVQYPQFGIPAVDAAVKAEVEKAVADFKTYPANPPESATPQNEFIGTFDSVYVGSDLVSVELILSEDTGGAHPNTVLVGENVDRKTGKELTLDDALRMVGKTLQQVSQESLARLNAKFAGAVPFPDGTSAKAENYSTFLVSADKVTFIFNDYQVASHADGPQEVSFERKL